MNGVGCVNEYVWCSKSWRINQALNWKCLTALRIGSNACEMILS